jgi:hypothetical protein
MSVVGRWRSIGAWKKRLALLACMIAVVVSGFATGAAQKSAPQQQKSSVGGTPQNQPITLGPVPGAGGHATVPPQQHGICALLPGCKTPDPIIAGLFPGSFLTPGGYILLYGKNFNSAQGPGGKLQFSLSGNVHDLVDLQWSDTSLGGRVPSGWNWNGIERVDVWLVRQDGTRSNSIQMDFTPTWEIQQLPAEEIHADCGGADKNYCSPSGNPPSIDTYHITIYGHDSGTDHYSSARLRNGWTLYEYRFLAKDLLNGSVQEPSGFNNGYDYLDLSVHWNEDGGSILIEHGARTAYAVNVFIRGPQGYSWK